MLKYFGFKEKLFWFCNISKICVYEFGLLWTNSYYIYSRPIKTYIKKKRNVNSFEESID